ncbi:FimV/HubP family polar landmark protein [Noviherbaspirillum sp. 1P10PC]|uniref:FimV/HubP family polar landmark protein n=1 Tax=Noviherbaspirillum sp. 1P10PC TaxID=3132292 RepID=UPI0039A0B5B6
MGQLTVLSALGQPLQAEIELTSVSKEEAGNVSVRLAPAAAFRQANIEFNPSLANLRFAVEQRGNRQVVRITSSQPMNEPFVDVLLEVSSNGTRLLREYVVLLDPVGSRRAQPAETAPAPAATPAAPAARQQASRAAPAAAPAAEAAASGDSYPVKRGDTLAAIAGQVKPEGVSLDQMLVALQRANPNAFVGNNINRLRTGQILSVPNAEAARSVSNGEARRIVVAQSADFNNYRNRLASQVAGSATGQGEGGQLASGKVTSRVEEQRNTGGETRDRLQVSRSGAPVSGADAEERIAQEKALAEANSRVKELEKTVGDLQRLLEIKNRDLAARQNQAAAPAAQEKPAAASDQPAAAAVASAAPASAASATPPAAEAGAPLAATTPTPTPAPAADNAAAAAAPAAQAAKPASKPAVPAPPPPPEPGMLEELTGNPAVLGGSALVLALLAALGITRSRKAKQAKAIRGTSIMPTSTLKTNSLFGAAGGQSVDTNNSVFNSNFSPSASQLDTNEVDPVAEADVYIAYGRDAQAEEILKEALRTQPDRAAVRGKLLEIYAARKDLRAFEATATELFSLTKGEGEEWAQAAILGLSLDPTNPLYASARKPSDGLDTGAGAGLAAGAGLGATAAASAADEAHGNEIDFDALLNTTQQSHQDDAPTAGEKADVEPSGQQPAASDLTETPLASSEMPVAPALPDVDSADVPDLHAAPAAGPAADPEATPATPEPASNLLDFDFDLDSFGKTPPPTPPAVHADEEPAEAAPADSRLMDFKLDDLDLPKPDAASASAAPSLDDDEFPPLELDVPGRPAETAAVHDESAPMDFDLSGISLDLDPHGGTDAALQDVPTLGETSYSNAAEMATKLDLASAYQEIGDREGARELLEEVIKGGDNEQSEKAKVLLAKLD